MYSLLSDIFSSLWFKQTKLDRWITIDLGVLSGGCSAEYLTADKTPEQAVRKHGKDFADLVVMGDR